MRYDFPFHRPVLAAAALLLAACASHEPRTPVPPQRPNGPPPGGQRMAAGGQAPRDGKPKPPPGGQIKPADAMKRIDTNHDGAISQQEQLDFALHEADVRFGHLDADHDGKVTQGEIDAAEKQREAMKANGGQRPGNGGPAGGGQNGKRPPPGGGLESLMARGDANHDGVIDQSENRAVAQQQVAQRFQTADRNGDGKLEKSEMPPPPGAPRQQPGQ